MKTATHRYWKYGTVIIGLFFITQIYENYTIKKSLKGVYHYNVQFTIVDKLTNQRLDRITTSGPGSSAADLFHQSSGIASLGEGRIEISGVAYEPRLWRVSSEGYDEVSVTVDADTPNQMRIELTKKQTEQGAAGNPLPAE